MIYSINKMKSALLIIDAQNEYSDTQRPLHVQDFKETVEKINQISSMCRLAKIPVILIKHVHDKSGLDVGRMGDFSSDEVFTDGTSYTDIHSDVLTDDNDIIVTKNRYSAFVNTGLESYLKTLNVDTIIITGFMTSYCSVTTARHGHDLDYKVIYIHDANSGPAFGDLGFGDVSIEEIKKVTSTLLAGGVAEVIMMEEVLSRLKD
jgi:nicotinamidase-related amidase